MASRLVHNTRYVAPIGTNIPTTGLNAQTMAAAKTSNTIDCHGFSQISYFIEYTDGTGSKLTVYPEVKCDADASWHRLTSASVSTGVATLSLLSYEYTPDVAPGANEIVIDIPLNYHAIRFVHTVTSGDATDILTTYAVLGAL